MNHIDTLIPEQQPDFPRCDLTEANIGALAITLGKYEVRERSHRLAEGADVALEIIHPAIVNGVSLHTDGLRVEAVNYGNVLLESAAGFVAQPSCDIQGINRRFSAYRTVGGLLQHGDNPFVSLSDEVDIFKDEMPNTTAFIEEMSRRSFATVIGYVIFGAALERKAICNTNTDAAE